MNDNVIAGFWIADFIFTICLIGVFRRVESRNPVVLGVDAGVTAITLLLFFSQPIVTWQRWVLSAWIITNAVLWVWNLARDRILDFKEAPEGALTFGVVVTGAIVAVKIWLLYAGQG